MSMVVSNWKLDYVAEMEITSILRLSADQNALVCSLRFGFHFMIPFSLKYGYLVKSVFSRPGFQTYLELQSKD